MSRLESTLLSIALVGIVTLAAYTEAFLVVAIVVIIQFMIASAPSPAMHAGHSVSAPRFLPAVLAGLIATAATFHPRWWVGSTGTHAGTIGTVDSGVFAGVLPGIATGVFVVLISQMFRKGGRESLVLTTGYAVTLSAFSALTAGWIGASQSDAGAPAVAVCAISLSVGLLVWLLPCERWIAGLAAVVAGAVSGGVAAPLFSGTAPKAWIFGAVAGLGVATFAILGQVLGRAWGEGRRHASSGWGFPGALSLALAAPVVFVAVQIVGVNLTLS